MADQDRKREWAERRGLRQSGAGGDPVSWLLHKRRPYNPPTWFDHGTRWTKDGKPHTLVGQPYGLGDEGFRELRELVDLGLKVWIHPWPAWHLPGGVLHVEVSVQEFLWERGDEC